MSRLPFRRRAASAWTAPEGPVDLEIGDLHAGYGDLDILRGVNMRLAEGEVVALLGANGAGKSTLSKAIIGMIKPSSGAIRFGGRDVGGWHPSAAASAGIALVPEGRRVFAGRTVVDNLLLGAWPRRKESTTDLRRSVDEVLGRFKRLSERRDELAGSLSGGEAQLLAIGMAMMARPRLIILDEPSLGLSPVAIEQVAAEIATLSGSGTTILLIEQNAHQALAIASRAYVMEVGTIRLEGPSNELLHNDEVRSAYLGV